MSPRPSPEDVSAKLVKVRRAALGVLLLQTALLLILAKSFVTATEPPAVSVVPEGPERILFGKTEQQRREMFWALVAGETGDRELAEAESETAIWNRNHDNYFHQRESWRILATSRRFGIPLWQMAFILDEGIRGHWPTPPGVVLRADDAPLRRTTLPLKERPVLTPAPP
jgi:hypothetical protein